MSTSSNGTYTFYWTIGGGFAIPPQCACGRGVPQTRLPDGRFVCRACVEDWNRRVAIEQAENWITGAFLACLPAQRSRLYRTLSSIFHPDVGGDERVMQVLNAVRGRFPD